MKKPGIKKTAGLMAMLSVLSLNTAALPGQDQPPRKDPVSERFKKEDFQKTWKRNAEKMGVEFTLPSYMREVPVEFRAALSIRYQRAFVHPKNKMQVRYALFRGERDFNPLNPIMLRVIAMNASGGAENFKPVSVPPNVAAGRYGADGGVLVVMPVKAESRFADGYRFVSVLGLHKKGRGSAYVFVLLDDLKSTRPLWELAVESLRFKSPPADEKTAKPVEQIALRALWDARAAQANLVVKALEDYHEEKVDSRAHRAFPHQRVFMRDDGGLEIRYALLPREERYRPMETNRVLAERIKKMLGSDEKFKITPIDRGDARREFGADGGVFMYGRTSSLSAFARGYRMVVVMGLEKEDAPYLFVFLLVRNQSAFSKPAFRKVFESARFRRISKKKKMPGTEI